MTGDRTGLDRVYDRTGYDRTRQGIGQDMTGDRTWDRGQNRPMAGHEIYTKQIIV